MHIRLYVRFAREPRLRTMVNGLSHDYAAYVKPERCQRTIWLSPSQLITTTVPSRENSISITLIHGWFFLIVKLATPSDERYAEYKKGWICDTHVRAAKLIANLSLLEWVHTRDEIQLLTFCQNLQERVTECFQSGWQIPLREDKTVCVW